MRRAGATYREVALSLGVGTSRVRQLVFAALQDEARAEGLDRRHAREIAALGKRRQARRNGLLG